MKKGWGIVVLAVLAATAQAEYRPTFGEGEQLTFRLRWGAMVGGYSTLNIENIESRDGRQAYHIVSEARSTAFVDTFYKVRDRNESWLEVGTPRSWGYIKKLREGSYQVDEEARFDHANNRFYMEKERLDKNRRTEKEGVIPPNVFDILSSFYYVRGMPLEVGKTITIDVHSGDKTWPLLVHVKRQEIVKVKAGRFDTFVVEPVLRDQGIFMHKGKKLEIWLTNDERRMPVQMRCEIKLGAVTAELVKSTPGTLPVETPRFAQTLPVEPNN